MWAHIYPCFGNRQNRPRLTGLLVKHLDNLIILPLRLADWFVFSVSIGWPVVLEFTHPHPHPSTCDKRKIQRSLSLILSFFLFLLLFSLSSVCLWGCSVAVIISFPFIHQRSTQMAEYDQIASKYLAYKSHSSFCEDVEYYTFVHRLLLPALGIKDATTIDLKNVLASYRVLDLACGGGYFTSEESFLMF